MRTLTLMESLDSAWNDRRWDDYADLLSPGFTGFRAGENTAHGKEIHVVLAKGFVDTFPDARVNDEYIEFFESADGKQSLSVSRLDGTMSGGIQLNGQHYEANNRSFSLTFATVSTWDDNRLISQRSFVDETTLMKQLGINELKKS